MAAQGRSGRSLAEHVELVEQDLLELRDDRHRMEPAGRGNESFGKAGNQPQEPDVAPDDLREARADHLDDDGNASREPRRMHLGDGRRGERRLVERLERLLDGRPERALHDDAGLHSRERRHVIEQGRELLGDVLGHEVGTRGQNLPELHEDGAEGFQGPTYPYRPGRTARVVVAAGPEAGHHEIESETDRDGRDADQPQELSHRTRRG